EIAALHKRLSNTMIYVTHDQIEAMTLADRIVVLRDGVIEQVGTPRELYANPANVFVAQFIGSPKMNLLPAPLVAEGLKKIGVDVPATAQVGMRPEHLHLTGEDGAILTGRVVIAEYTGAGSLLHIQTADGGTVLVSEAGQDEPPIGATVSLKIEPQDIHVF
ncbi:MAG: ABC transporter ATP-binding protein, partial [Pseudomonadota bacterium]